ncbi:hypothetical protein CCHR01_04654 [Colletotrichum chrysophilum]|uniref:Uncharacterized protein n=1 Tax=Colletotrichum chrysophilum TaxID=1836956 RepID=A0AAD9ELG8_9PEZI|nr:hypothetical protein CCHR01_04654 [Colletotrichum chrysophilum]
MPSPRLLSTELVEVADSNSETDCDNMSTSSSDSWPGISMAGSDEIDGDEPIKPSSPRPVPRLRGILKSSSSGDLQKAQTNVSGQQTQSEERDPLGSGPLRRMNALEEEQRRRRKRYRHRPYADSRRKMSHNRVEGDLSDTVDEDENADGSRNWVHVTKKPCHDHQHHHSYNNLAALNTTGLQTPANAISNVGQQVGSPRSQLYGNLPSLQLDPRSPVETHNASHSPAPAGGLNMYGVHQHRNYFPTTNQYAGGFHGQARYPYSHRRRLGYPIPQQTLGYPIPQQLLGYPIPQQDRTQQSEPSWLAGLYNSRDRLRDEFFWLRSRPRDARDESFLAIVTAQLHVASLLLTHSLRYCT